MALHGLLTAALPAAPAVAGTPTGTPDAPAYLLRITAERPPCTPPAGLPIVPDDPGALARDGTSRCYGTRPRELQVRLPAGVEVWLTRAAANPATWVAVGPVLVDPSRLSPPPLGLRLTQDGESLMLETRYGGAATLAPLKPDAWQPVRQADGGKIWVHVSRP